MTSVGVIGLGQIGAGVARSVSGAGHQLVVHDVRPEAAEAFAEVATAAASPAELAGQVEVVVVAVVDDDQVHHVLEGPGGVLEQAAEGTTVLLLSTVSADTVQAVGRAAAERGVAVVDCGVSGGPGAAASGDLVSMVGGDAAAVERIAPVLDAFSSTVVRMGPLGAGLQAKLARNLVQYASWLAAYEAQLLAEAAGIELAKLGEVIRASDPLIGGPTRLMFRDTVAPFGPDDDRFLVDAMTAGANLARKDLGAVVALADALGVELPLAEMTRQRAGQIFGLGPSDDEGEGA